MGAEPTATAAPTTERADHGGRVTAGLLMLGLGNLVWTLLWWLAGATAAALGQPMLVGLAATAAWVPLTAGIIGLALAIAVLWSTASTRDGYSDLAVVAATAGAAAQTIALGAYPLAVVVGLSVLGAGAVTASVTLHAKPARRRSFVTDPGSISPLLLVPLVALAGLIAVGGVLGSVLFQFVPYLEYASDPLGWQSLASEQYRPSEFALPAASDDLGSVAVLPFIASIVLGLVGVCALPVALFLSVPLRSARSRRQTLSAGTAHAMTGEPTIDGRRPAGGIRFTSWLLVVGAVLASAHLAGAIAAVAAGVAAGAGPLPLELRLPFALQTGFFVAIAGTVLLARLSTGRQTSRWWWYVLLWAGAPVLVLLAFSGV